MKNLFLACFLIFSFEEAFSAQMEMTTTKKTKVVKPTNQDKEIRQGENMRARIGDEVVTGQSATQRRAMPSGSMRGVQKGSIQGARCTNSNGIVFTPGKAGYRECVDKANRVQ